MYIRTVTVSAEMPAIRSLVHDVRPRILHYLSGDVRGGIEEHALSLLRSLPDHGFEPYLAASPALLELLAKDLQGSQVRTLVVRRNSQWDFSDAATFSRALRSERIDLVHSHLFIGSMFASPLAKWARVRAVIETFHLREVWREGKPLKGSFWIDRQIGRWVDRYIAVSVANAHHLVTGKRLPSSKICVIYNGRDVNHFRPLSEDAVRVVRAELGVSEGPVALVLGRLEPQKGHAFLISALADLVVSFPTLRTLFVGTGQLEGKLKACCSILGLDERILFLGQRGDPERLLAAADVVILPSLFEGLPLSAIEALAAARPLVATDVAGTREVVINEQTGLLVPPADSSALATAIRRVLREPQLGRRLGINGRAWVETNFDVKKQIAETVDVYLELLSRPAEKATAGQIDSANSSLLLSAVQLR
jgi:glycosyltransferase involved in cell wall biosynthesis